MSMQPRDVELQAALLKSGLSLDQVDLVNSFSFKEDFSKSRQRRPERLFDQRALLFDPGGYPLPHP